MPWVFVVSGQPRSSDRHVVGPAIPVDETQGQYIAHDSALILAQPVGVAAVSPAWATASVSCK